MGIRDGFCAAVLVVVLFCFTAALSAEAVGTDVEYKEGDTVLLGYLVYDNAISGKRPGVLVIHEWNGLGEYVKSRAKQLALLGYTVFCADIYGKGIRPKNRDESGATAGIYRADRKLMRKRALAGLKELLKQKITDKKRTAVIGYCFGGGAALELARSGADISGAVSFHGNLDTPLPAEKGKIKANVLVLHGAEDAGIPQEKVDDFMEEMDAAQADWQLNIYSGAVHGFTNPSNKDAYNEKADKRSWEAMKAFFGEIFR